MTKILMVIFVAMLFPLLTYACDICGCGVGNSYIGILPDFNKRIFGVRYRYSSLLTHVGVNGATTYLTAAERYNTTELWGGISIGKHFRVMAAVPYTFNERENQGISKRKNGIGDISFTGYYQAISKKKTILTNKLLVQSLWVGGGVKLPTGRYNPADKSAAGENANLFQSGTASTDFTINAMYDIRLQDIGLSMAASYKINTANKYEYAYGNKGNINAQVYYKIRIKDKITIAPNTGVQYESAETDLDKGFAVDVSGGNLLLGSAGIESSYKKISVGANWQSPLSQNLGRGFVKADNRMMVHVSLMF